MIRRRRRWLLIQCRQRAKVLQATVDMGQKPHCSASRSTQAAGGW